MALAISGAAIAIAIHGRGKLREVPGEPSLVVQAVVNSFNKRMQSYDEKVAYAVATAERAVQDVTTVRQPSILENPRVDAVTRAAESALSAVVSITKTVRDLASKVALLTKGQQDLTNEIGTLDGRYRGLLPEADRRTLLPVSAEAAIVKLTPTELRIIGMLGEEGPKSAAEIIPVIGKTREHTGRLMKKLHIEGYVDRESGIPFKYNISERVKDAVQRLLKRQERTTEP